MSRGIKVGHKRGVREAHARGRWIVNHDLPGRIAAQREFRAALTMPPGTYTAGHLHELGERAFRPFVPFRRTRMRRIAVKRIERASREQARATARA